MKDEPKMIAVREEYLIEIECALHDYDRELQSALECHLTAEEEESLERARARLFRLKVETRTAQGLSTELGEYEQECDECGCDVHEVMMTLDEREVCASCFQKGVR